jgi:histidyl-tRNA synthetase
MNIQAVKGTRDFYPQDMRLRNWIVDAWRRVSLRNGFEEYDAPIFEYLDLFTVKSGQEIAEQLFRFTDRGGRNLAIRPEITPSLARMVNARISSLPRPIKWFSVPRLCRAEKPQRGRLREFYQWNVDVIGSDEVLADAEGAFVAMDLVCELGLSSKDVHLRIGSRPLTMAALEAAGVAAGAAEAMLPILDKRTSLDDEEFDRLCRAGGMDAEQTAAVRRFQDAADVESVRRALKGAEGVEEEIDKLRRMLDYLSAMGVGDYCRLDMRTVRGLAYYTGVVYEVWDAKGELRALAGGGRYDNLLEVLGGPAVGATGFGMGDVVLGILLEQKGRLPAFAQRLEYFVIDAEDGLLEKVIAVAGALRRAGRAADYSLKRQSLGKQLKEANRRGAEKAVIVRPDALAVKDLASGRQSQTTLERLTGA